MRMNNLQHPPNGLYNLDILLCAQLPASLLLATQHPPLHKKKKKKWNNNSNKRFVTIKLSQPTHSTLLPLCAKVCKTGKLLRLNIPPLGHLIAIITIITITETISTVEFGAPGTPSTRHLSTHSSPDGLVWLAWTMKVDGPSHILTNELSLHAQPTSKCDDHSEN